MTLVTVTIGKLFVLQVWILGTGWYTNTTFFTVGGKGSNVRSAVQYTDDD